MPIGKGLGHAVRNGHKIGCTTVQVFTNNPRQWAAKPIKEETVEDLAAAMQETGIDQVISHDTYLVNLCAPNPETQAKSIAALKEELCRCSQLGIPFAVSHMGAHMKLGEEVGLKIVAEKAKEVLADTPDDVTLLMETTAGQGSSLNWQFDHIAAILDQTGAPERLCVCLDTRHIYAAGYDISTEDGYTKTFDDFERLVGIDRIKVIHCNDSKKECGSRVDRHDHIGEGLMGITPFQMLVNDKRFEQTPIILETPSADDMHEVNLNKLKSLRKD
jgi:deoxyribonuclease-4